MTNSFHKSKYDFQKKNYLYRIEALRNGERIINTCIIPLYGKIEYFLKGPTVYFIKDTRRKLKVLLKCYNKQIFHKQDIPLY